MLIYCTITSNNGQRVPLRLENTDALTPTELRQKVSGTTKIPIENLRLIFRGRMIKDGMGSVVAEYKLENDSVLHCMGKPVADATADVDEKTGTASSASAATVSSATPPNRTVVPPLSTGTAPASASASFAASLASSLRPTPSSPLTKALARLKQNNPPSVYATAIGTLKKVLANIVNNALEEKYRTVKRNNAVFGKRLGKLVGGHDCMLATGFVVEQQSGEEVYQLHASADNWNALLAAKAIVEGASSVAKLEQERAQRPASAMMQQQQLNPLPGGFPAPDTNEPNFGSILSHMMSNPEALGQALQSPMVQQLMRNDPNVSPMMRQYMETMANNPAVQQQMSQRMTQRMQDPAIQARLRAAMQSGDIPGMGGMAGMAPSTGGSGTNAAAAATPQQPPPPPQNDQGQTEDEMMAEAIRRSLEDN